ncbi:unnamed protein product [marine sediment metagenome]|uniref:Uncharacterized protein n=1 Tax=marine sediment metagenome TaxID=412755 RepID=X1ELZ3_9ZZZZ
MVWYTISPAPWSIMLYAIWAWWASKKIPKDKYIRLHRLAAWADAIWVAGVIVLVGDIQWVIAVWLRWISTYPDELNLLVNCMIRNISILAISLIMSWNLWKSKLVQWGPAVNLIWGVNLLYLLLWFGLAPGLEWTHWVYALENGYSIWPFTWFISFIVGRIITTIIFWRTWNVKLDR